MNGKNVTIKLVSEFYGTFGDKYFLEIISDANTSVIEISEVVFDRIKSQQDFRAMGLIRDMPLGEKINICNQRKEWG